MPDKQELASIMELKTSPEIEKNLAKQLEELPRLALTAAADKKSNVFGLVGCCNG